MYVSNAPVLTTVQVPAVAALGLTEAQAKARLALYGLKAKVIDLETPDYKPGLCIYQSPAAGATVKIGSAVDITIAREPQTTTTTTAPPTTTTTAPPSTTTTAPPTTTTTCLPRRQPRADGGAPVTPARESACRRRARQDAADW